MKIFHEEPTKEVEIIGLHMKLLEKYDDDLNKNATLGFEKKNIILKKEPLKILVCCISLEFQCTQIHVYPYAYGLTST
jgi:hypothetical protein